MPWDFDEIAALNPRQPGQARSTVERLLDLAATTPDLLCELADRLETQGGRYVAAMFQLPGD